LASTGSNLVRGQPWSFWWIIAQLENPAAARLFSVLIAKMAISDAKGRENQLQREVIGWAPERERISERDRLPRMVKILRRASKPSASPAGSSPSGYGS
jgi:hypothetical protein